MEERMKDTLPEGHSKEKVTRCGGQQNPWESNTNTQFYGGGRPLQDDGESHATRCFVFHWGERLLSRKQGIWTAANRSINGLGGELLQ